MGFFVIIENIMISPKVSLRLKSPFPIISNGSLSHIRDKDEIKLHPLHGKQLFSA
jgi:hypothetical protein